MAKRTTVWKQEGDSRSEQSDPKYPESHWHPYVILLSKLAVNQHTKGNIWHLSLAQQHTRVCTRALTVQATKVRQEARGGVDGPREVGSHEGVHGHAQAVAAAGIGAGGCARGGMGEKSHSL